ncbi:YcaO-like family protein [Labrenzia sp. 011]|uniref:YcaO-like family protein n=1 Tax=Labrenzia sp. 011 TaxID=2171494 RepID=UPI001403ACEB|nr:YcaO-like family protein [Labrenzia sp. 011]
MGAEKRHVDLPGQVVTDLVRAGLLVDDNGTGQLRMAHPGLAVFLPLLASFDVRLVPVVNDACPVRFCSGLLKIPSAESPSDAGLSKNIPAGGQGRTPAGAAIGCVGELAERISLYSQGKRDARIFTDDKSQPEVDLPRMLGLSCDQERALAARIVCRGTAQGEGTPDWSAISGRKVLIRRLGSGGHAAAGVPFPSIGVLFNEMEQAADGVVSLASSAGCAVWSDLAGARERALLELVERDAVAQAWYNRLGITSLESGRLGEILPASLSAFLSDRHRQSGLFAVDTDLDAVVVMAVSHEQDGRRAAFGSSAGWDLATACESAVQEMLQSEYALELMEKAYSAADASGEKAGSLPRQLVFARERSILEEMPLREASPASPATCERTFCYDGLLQSCIEKGLEIWEFDATRADVNVPCVKLLSPDLCSWEPRFGKRRLFDGVVDRGLRAVPATEAEFAARPFPF